MAARDRRGAEALRKKQLGQYFTPPHVAAALVDLVRRVRPPLPSEPTVADLACGDGALLLAALTEQLPLTTPERCYGQDIDARLEPAWRTHDVLRRCRLRVGDGLAPLAEQGLLPLEGVDLVLGNPPYNGAQGLITDRGVLSRFELGRQRGAAQAALFGFDPPTVTSQPVEALFVEQSLNAAKAGGYIALILPEGLLANQGCQDVRDLILRQAELLAVIGLPQRVFENAAKTDILLMRKRAPQERGRAQSQPVFLATLSRAVAKGDPAELKEAVRLFAEGAARTTAQTEAPLDAASNLAAANRVFFLSHRAEEWEEHPPQRWYEQGYWRHLRLRAELPTPQPGDPVLIYKRPAESPGAGFCAVMRAADVRLAEEGGYEVLADTWVALDPPVTFATLGELPHLRDAWPAYRFHFRGWAAGGAVPPAAWQALLPALTTRLCPTTD